MTPPDHHHQLRSPAGRRIRLSREQEDASAWWKRSRVLRDVTRTLTSALLLLIVKF